MKIQIKVNNPIKRRSAIAMDLCLNPLYRNKAITSKKVYNRKKIKKDSSNLNDNV